MENMREQNKPVRKKFNINGEIVEKMVVQEVIEDEYDENGNLIFHRYTKGRESLLEFRETKYYEYDKDGRLIRLTGKDDYGDESIEWYEYDEHGNEVYYRNSDNLEKRTEHDYDENGRLVHSKGRDDEKWYEYDNQGNLILIRKKENDCEYYDKDEYDTEDKYEYDASGNIIYKEEGDWKEWNEYDENGVIKSSRRKTSIGTSIESLRYYDEDGNVVLHKYCENGSEEEYWYKYKFWENGTIKQRIRYRAVDEE